MLNDNPNLSDPCTNTKLILTDFLIWINIYQYSMITYQYLINAYIIKLILKGLWPIFNQ